MANYKIGDILNSPLTRYLVELYKGRVIYRSWDGNGYYPNEVREELEKIGTLEKNPELLQV